MNTFLYPGTFDPFTLGHEDVARRSAKMCGRLIVAVSKDRTNCMFGLEERVAFVKEVLRDLKNCEVVAFSGLTAEFAKSVGAGYIIRGVRSVSDFEYEHALAINYKVMAPDIENILLLTDKEFAHISSSVVRDIIKYNGNLDGYISRNIIKRIKELNLTR